MSLSDYLWDEVRITIKDGKVYEGDVTSFTDSIMSETGYEEIEMRPFGKGYRVGIGEFEIDTVEILVRSEYDPFGSKKQETEKIKKFK